MTTVTRTFPVDPAPATVLDYLKDFSHAEQWDPGTQSCTREGSGPIVAGATWHNVSRVAGVTTELTYTLKSITDDRLVLVGVNEAATSTDTITVVPEGTGSRITYQAEIDMHGAAKLATPAVKIVFERIGNETERQMTRVINAL